MHSVLKLKVYFSIYIYLTKESIGRYYATFKVKKFESLLYKINNTCLQKATTYIGLQSKYSQ